MLGISSVASMANKAAAAVPIDRVVGRQTARKTNGMNNETKEMVFLFQK